MVERGARRRAALRRAGLPRLPREPRRRSPEFPADGLQRQDLVDHRAPRRLGVLHRRGLPRLVPHVHARRISGPWRPRQQILLRASAHGPAPAGAPLKASPRASSRRRSRELALQGLYQWIYTGNSASQVLKNLSELEGFGEADREFLEAELKGVIAEAGGLREYLEPLADRKWDEVSPVERG